MESCMYVTQFCTSTSSSSSTYAELCMNNKFFGAEFILSNLYRVLKCNLEFDTNYSVLDG